MNYSVCKMCPRRSFFNQNALTIDRFFVFWLCRVIFSMVKIENVACVEGKYRNFTSVIL